MNEPAANRVEENDSGLTPNLPPSSDHGKTRWVRCIMQVFWPAFVGSAITVGVLFSFIDPLQIEWVHVYLDDSRQAAYTIGFLLLWLLYALACSMTWYLATTETPRHSPHGATHGDRHSPL